MTQIYSIEGNIGSGKSTLVKILKEYFKNDDSKKIIFADEPVKEWMSVVDSSGDDILSKFYRDQHRYGFSFQMMAYISRISVLRKLVKENPNSIIFTERSIYTDKNVFAQMLHDEGKIDEIDFTIYNKWFNHFLEEIDITGIIYIQTNPEKCAERIIKRNRKGENISLEYLKLCHQYHENWLNSSTNVLKFNGNYDLDEDIKSYSNMIDNIVGNITIQSN